MKERYSYKDISVQLMNGSSDGGAEKAYNTALDRFTAQLAEDHVIRVVDMVRIEPERVKKEKRHRNLPVSGRLRRRMGRDSIRFRETESRNSATCGLGYISYKALCKEGN